VACTSPLKAYKAPGGGIAFDPRRGFFDRHLELPCGQCLSCRTAKLRDWAIRCVHEAQTHEKNCFISLTYNDESLPTNNSVDVTHWQLFAKRLRRKMGPFRFLHCGEYGEEKKRPHYHACLFGIDFAEDRVVFEEKPNHILWTSAQLEKIWGLGYATIGPLNFDTAAYCAAYTQKKVRGPKIHDQKNKSQQRKNYEHDSLSLVAKAYQRVDTDTGEITTVKPEYATMSRRPGLGSKWFAKYQSDVYPDDFVVIKGKKFRPPKYYDQLLEKKNPMLMEKLKEQRRKKSNEHPEEQTYKRKEVQNTVQKAKLAIKKRKL